VCDAVLICSLFTQPGTMDVIETDKASVGRVARWQWCWCAPSRI
jgi:hypothetical protein